MRTPVACLLLTLLFCCSDSGASKDADARGGGANGGNDAGASGAEGGMVTGSGADASGGASDPTTDAGPLDELGMAPMDDPNAIEIGVKNACPFPIWIHAQGQQATLTPDDQKLLQGEVRWYRAPKAWSAARITAFGEGPRLGELDKVEMTLVDEAEGAILNYNVTYVDWLGLPVSVTGIGTGDDCERVSCDVAHAQVLTGCPSGLLAGDRCLSPRSYCLDPTHSAEPLCSLLDDEIARCAKDKPGCEGAAGATSAEAFACSGFFASTPKWCAALNRGMLDDPDSTDLSKYYSSPPYNQYAKWVHDVCPGIYAFAYDDYPAGAEESGFHACRGGRELHVTFCPRG